MSDRKRTLQKYLLDYDFLKFNIIWYQIESFFPRFFFIWNIDTTVWTMSDDERTMQSDEIIHNRLIFISFNAAI